MWPSNEIIEQTAMRSLRTKKMLIHVNAKSENNPMQSIEIPMTKAECNMCANCVHSVLIMIFMTFKDL